MPVSIFVINLLRRADRRAAIDAQLAAAGLRAEFVAAVDGNTLELAAYRDAGQPSRGEIACYLSHTRIWAQVIDRQLAFALVLEDDVLIDRRLAQACEAIAQMPLGVDVIRLGSLMRPCGFKIAEIAPGIDLLAPSRNASGMHAYLVSQQGARRLLRDFAEPRQPVDRVLDQAWHNGLDVLLAAPPLASPRNSNHSDIAALGLRARRSARGNRLQRWIERIRRNAQALRLQRLMRLRLSGRGATPYGRALAARAAIP
ncbi:MAG: hypothetical protein JWQ90_606 [Hydrocarboniphaga sp.]|uniref:glycosyltransferase family 25 protein n=1 Tax=Hydrocarboniphaga sp. TaxID=2033016 RepID=UPI002635C6B6|nr:glycosyltransferase family 25 protein [Hydrocarboniphaga sp.]MDB5968156.1 hypothetical protein [Hydrocarboniphaga sp.]